MSSGLDRMTLRLEKTGGVTAEERFLIDKDKSLAYALENSYQAEWIQKVDFETGKIIGLSGQVEYENEIPIDKKLEQGNLHCLLNSDKLTDQYDKKMISIDYNQGIEEGSIFYWNRTNTYWLVLLQEFTEGSYFRGEARRCLYQVNNWWVYLRGPVETELVWNQKHNLTFNDLNYTLLMYVTKNEETLEFFSRFKVFKFQGHNWRVTATDKYSQPGVICIHLEEYYDNEDEDNMEPTPIQPIPEDPAQPYIEGPQIVKVFDKNLKYSIKNLNSGSFVVNSNKVEIIESTDSYCILNILASKSTEFNLIYQIDGLEQVNLHITVEPMF